MKCFELTRCSEKERESCFVWNSLHDNPEDMENVKCWVIKGAYQQDNREQLQKCQKCKYYVMLNKDTGVVSGYDADLAVINCEGTINNDRSKALEKIWENLKKSNKFKVLLRMSDVKNVYSCGLGVIIKIHKEAASAGGMLVVEGAHDYVKTIFESARLDKILHLTATTADSKALFEIQKKKQETAAPTVEKPQPVKAPPKERVPCYVYWENHNPRNATTCDECFRKIKPSDQPCWIVEGMVEGISFQYVNEECQECGYFGEFGPAM